MANSNYPVRFFEWREGEAAAEWARTGGIAVHRNFDVDGLKIGIKVRAGAAFHVLASSRNALVEWGRAYGQRPNWLQAPKGRGIFEGLWHYDVFGWPARKLLKESESAHA